MRPKPTSRAAFLAATMCLLTLLPGCATRETYGDSARPPSDSSLIEGYSRYLLLYFEDLQIATVDGQHVGGRFAHASSVSVPAGRHWLQFLILRNDQAITSCAFDGTFEPGHRYKLQHLEHEQGLLAHPTSARFPATISMQVVEPAGAVRTVAVRAECGEGPHCRSSTDCPADRRCRLDAGFAFGMCERPQGR